LNDKLEFAAKEKLEIVKERGEPACGRAAKSGGFFFAACGGEICSNYFQYSAHGGYGVIAAL